MKLLVSIGTGARRGTWDGALGGLDPGDTHVPTFMPHEEQVALSCPSTVCFLGYLFLIAEMGVGLERWLSG